MALLRLRKTARPASNPHARPNPTPDRGSIARADRHRRPTARSVHGPAARKRANTANGDRTTAMDAPIAVAPDMLPPTVFPQVKRHSA